VVGASVLGVLSGGSVVVGSSLASSAAVAGAAVGALSDVVSPPSSLQAVAARRQTAAITPRARVAVVMIPSLLPSEHSLAPARHDTHPGSRVTHPTDATRADEVEMATYSQVQNRSLPPLDIDG